MNNTVPAQFKKAPDPQTMGFDATTLSEQLKGGWIILAFIVILIITAIIGAYTTYTINQNFSEHWAADNESETEESSVPTNQQTQSSEIEEFYDSAQEANRLWSEGKYEEMLELSEELIKNAPDVQTSAVAYYWNGLAHYNLDDMDRAENSLYQAISLEPTYAGPHVTMAAIRLNEGNYTDALTHAEKCVELDPSYAWCYNSLGLAYLSLGRTDEGVEALEKAVSLNPDVYVFQDNLKRARGE